MGNLTGRIRDAIRGVARSESLRQLEKRGVRKVNVLGLDRIVALIEEAVERSLRDRLLRYERTEVAATTKQKFLELLERNQSLVEDRATLLREKQEAEAAVQELRDELTESRDELARRVAEAEAVDAARHADREDRLLDAFTSAVRAAEPDPDRADRLVERLGGFVVRAVREQRREAEADPSPDEQLENLRRRIRKLTDSLSDSERRLRETLDVQAHDRGVASIYKSVQGLSGSESHYERKKELMADIFVANLSLQKNGNASKS